ALALSTPKPPAAMRHGDPQSASHPLPIPPRKGEGVRSGTWHAPVPATGRHLPPCGGGWEGGRRTLRAIAVCLTIALALVLPITPALAQTDDATLTALVDALAPGNFRDREAAAAALAATGDP